MAQVPVPSRRGLLGSGASLVAAMAAMAPGAGRAAVVEPAPVRDATEAPATPLQGVAARLVQMEARLDLLERDLLEDADHVDRNPEREIRAITDKMEALQRAGAHYRALTVQDAAVQAGLCITFAGELIDFQLDQERTRELGELITRAMASVLLALRQVSPPLDLAALGQGDIPWIITREFPEAVL